MLGKDGSMHRRARGSLSAFAFALLFFWTTIAFAQADSSPEYYSRRIIVKFKPAARVLTGSAAGARMARLRQMRPVKTNVATRTKPLPGGVERIYVAEIGDGENLDEVLKELAANPEVEYAERDYIMTADAADFSPAVSARRAPLEPDDPFFSWQWGLKNTGQTNDGTTGMDVNAVNAWDITTGDSSTILAILDTGITFNAPEFEGRILPGYDYVNGDDIPADDYGHGMKMAGIAAATGGNGILIAGMNWRCRILPVKILNASGNGSYSNFAQGIMYAADQGAKVISISAGGTDVSKYLTNAVDYASSHGVIIVASMGNSNVESPARYPAATPGVIAVGAVDSRGRRAVPFSCSNSGGSNYGNHISFVAPGDSIISLDYNDPWQLASRPGCGTSDAVPFVSGLVSLMFSINPLLTYDQVYEALKAGARDQIGFLVEDTPGWDQYYGWGLIDAQKTLQSLPPVVRTYFAQVAVGGGATTTFTFMNTGAAAAAGSLALTGNDGTPLSVIFSSSGQADTAASSFPINIPSGGTLTVTARAIDTASATVAGWGRVESSGGSVSGVATFQLAEGNKLTTIAGVLAAAATSAAGIPLNDDISQGLGIGYSTGYAIANPGDEDVNVTVTMLNSDGSFYRTISPEGLNPLKPGWHVARFLWEDLGDDHFNFQGSMVLTESSGKAFCVVALVMNRKLFTAIPVISASTDSAGESMFAQVVVGEGFTTAFSFLNSSAVAASGTLILTGDDGQPVGAAFSSPGYSPATGSSCTIAVPAGGTQVIVAEPLNPSDPIQRGWARAEMSAGTLHGVATYQLKSSDRLKSVAGVLSAAPTSTATIPISDDITQGAGVGHSTGYAIANPGDENMNIIIMILNSDGSLFKAIAPADLNPLRPGRHVPRFLWQDLADDQFKFEGSMILNEPSGKAFSIVALVMNQQLFTAIPVIPAKAPGR
jgi:thermitase